MKLIAICCLWLLLFPALTWAVPVYDNSATQDCNFCSQNSFSLTIGGGCSSNIVIVSDAAVYTTSPTITNLTVDGNAASSVNAVTESSTQRAISMYQKTGVATGSRAIVIDYQNSDSVVMSSAESYCDVNQGTPLGVSQTFSTVDMTTTPLSVTVNSTSGELVIDAILDGGEAATPGGGQTEKITANISGYFTHRTSEKAGAASVTMDWTTVVYGQGVSIAVPLKPSASVTKKVRRPAVIFQ